MYVVSVSVNKFLKLLFDSPSGLDLRTNRLT